MKIITLEGLSNEYLSGENLVSCDNYFLETSYENFVRYTHPHRIDTKKEYWLNIFLSNEIRLTRDPVKRMFLYNILEVSTSQMDKDDLDSIF